MNGWQLAAAALTAALVPCGWVCLRRSFAEGLVAIQVAAAMSALALLTLAEAEGREPFANLALVLAVLSFAGTLVFLRFLERQR
ncbi:MAG TPA: monovalent cation/H+ antiporter complex subunit F [Solirubrobacterales bacterium]|nr:monovalent cation/H+ antiporter complex subunit F [Solirubrobacterales bacterium]